MNKKLLYTISVIVTLSASLAKADDSWNILKYFTAAYWFPYTCGNQVELEAQQNRPKKDDWSEKDVANFMISSLIKAHESSRSNDDKLTKFSSGNDFKENQRLTNPRLINRLQEEVQDIKETTKRTQKETILLEVYAKPFKIQSRAPEFYAE